MLIRLKLAFAASFFAIASVAAHPQIATSDNAATLHEESQEVLLDFVARDKHEKLVADLQAKDIQVYEDGVLQRPSSFRYTSGVATAGTPPPGPGQNTSAYDPLRELNLVTIVFAEMSNQSRLQATQYALDFLTHGLGPNTWMGVLTLSHRLGVVQPYTSKISLLQAAVRRASAGEYQTFARESASLLQRINDYQSASDSLSAARYQPVEPGSAEEKGPATGAGTAAAALLTIERQMLQQLYQQSGERSIDALRSLVRAQAALPGRKTILYISEGLVIPPEQPELLRGVISDANQANVTFYTLDARGLQMTTNRTAANLTASAINDDVAPIPNVSPSEPPPSSGPTLTLPQSLRTDLQANARELATGTGGFAMDNGNDLRGPLLRVMEDVRAHYEITYTPNSRTLDGHFRSIEVKTLRPGIRIRSRKGYYAVPLLNGQPLSLVEMAGMRALNTLPLPRDFDFQFAALQLSRVHESAAYSLTFSVPAKSIRFAPAPTRNRFLVRVACLAIVRQIGSSGNIIAKVSQDVPYSIPAGRRAAFQAGVVTTSMPLILPPGRYHIDAALLDVEAATAAVKKISIVSDSAALSDLVWVRSVHPQGSADSSALDPLDTPYGLLTPEITGIFQRGENPDFFFRVFDASPAVSGAQMVLSQNGVIRRKIALHLPTPAADGSIAYLGELPAHDLEAGEYEVELDLPSGGTTLIRLSRLRLTADGGPATP